MDYKYINQLLERYWECQTTLEEEAILRSFFSQDDIPASLLQYRNLFVYEAMEPKHDKLGDDFDAKVLAMIGEEKPAETKVISLKQRLMPLFRAAAIVAILLTLGNAIQMSIDSESTYNNVAGSETENIHGTSVAKSDSLKVDSLHRSSLTQQESNALSPF